MKEHNFEKEIPLYKTTPDKIIREEVEYTNDIKNNLNKQFVSKYNFKPGDIVKVILKKENLEKSRK